jgi:acyl-coenzyme A synthetase/AMP-(fatty) acid ligase/acyl carrier protein
VIFTSGSTGTPKPVPVEHRQLTAYLDAVATRVGQVGSAALVSTIAADLGLLNVYGALTTGGTLHLLDREAATDPVAFAAHRVDVLKCVPSQLELLASHGDLGSVLPRRLLVLAGEAVPWTLVDRIAEARPDLEVQVHYGPTETTVSVLGCTAAEMPRLTAYVPLGTPFPGVRCFVADRAGRPVPDGIPGELWIGGPQVARGHGPFHRSGDRARIRPDGAVEFLGRVDDQVKIRGHRVELGELESVAGGAPGVLGAVVVVRGDGADRELVLFLLGTGDHEAVRERLRTALPAYMVPSWVFDLDAVPTSASGKTDRSTLLRLAEERIAAARCAAPAPVAAYADALEEELAAIWAEVLKVDAVERDRPVLEYGAHSLSMFAALSQVQGKYAVTLQVVDFFRAPTVANLAGLVRAAGYPGS